MRRVDRSALSLVLLFSASVASAQTSTSPPPEPAPKKGLSLGVGPRVGLILDDGSFSLGAEGRLALVPLSSSLRLDVRPSFDFYFVGSDATLLQGAVDGLLAFKIQNSPIEPYAIAGLAIVYTNTDAPAEFSSTDVGINLGAGAKYVTSGRFHPFAEIRVSIYDQSFFHVALGVLLQL